MEFLEAFEAKVLEERRIWALSLALRATPVKWWDECKTTFQEWGACRVMLLLHLDPLVHLHRKKARVIIRSCAELHTKVTDDRKGSVSDRCTPYRNSCKIMDTTSAVGLATLTAITQLRSFKKIRQE